MKCVLAAVVLADVLLSAISVCAQNVPTQQTAQPATSPENRFGPPAPKQDLDQIQGLWTRTERTGLFRSRRIEKRIEQDKETLTEYEPDGKVSSAHTVKVALYRLGPIRIFSYSDMVITEGPNKGQRSETVGAYIYKVVGDTFIEIWGILGEGDDAIRELRWTRQSGAK